MDSPDQGATNIPVTEVLISEKEITLKVKSIGGIYQGNMQDDKQTIKGVWTQNKYQFSLNLTKSTTAPEVNRPQEPKKPYPYDEKDISIRNSEQGITLTGTFTFPKNTVARAAIILISGSGAQDRDETIFVHKPYLVLSDFLTRKGFAVLRYDDRGVGGSTGSLSNSTIDDLSTDVIAAVNYIKTTENFDMNNIGLIGHSEGGWVASLVAAKIPDISFIILLATPGISGLEIVCDQVENLNKTMGLKEDVVRQNVALQRRILEIVKNEKDDKIATEKLIDLVPENKKAQIKTLISVKYRSMISFDPQSVLKVVKCPVLALNGEKDIQVNSSKNLKAISVALKEGGNTNYITQEIPHVNHLFQTSKTGLISEYGKIEETISNNVLELIEDWIQKVL
jgi:pimeloyl-ACP methyl ester carboxylesterase